MYVYCITNNINGKIYVGRKPKSLEHRKNLSIEKTGIPAPAVVESNIRRRGENPTPAALRNREYRARKKTKVGSNA
jgi:hypothetical protein